MANDFAVFFQYEIQFGNEVGIIAIMMQDEMLDASRCIDIPKSFSGEVFHLPEVCGLFESYIHGFLMLIGMDIIRSFQ